jgi:hypothetical protein
MSDRKKYANDALNELVLLIHAMRTADRKRMKFIGLTDADLSENDFKHIVEALKKMGSIDSADDEGETLEIHQV